MRIRRELVYAALATTLVACFDEGGERDDDDGATGAPVDGGVGVVRPVDAVLPAPSRGAAVALSPDESTAVVVNRDVGSVSVLTVRYEDGQITRAEPRAEVQLGAGAEPWQTVIGPDGDTAYVVLRKDQKLARIKNLKTKPVADGFAPIGSEPTSVALSPSGHTAYVSNWADGTVSVIDTLNLTALPPIDLNAALVNTGYLGQVTPRPALAHPRAITVSNDLDKEDADETLYVTEYYSQQVAPLQADGLNADTNRAGVVYKVNLGTGATSTVTLAALDDIGFKDVNGVAAGCFPNQLQSITLNGDFAYVVSICAAPEGPEGIKVTTTACTTVADCQAPELKLVDPVCDVVAFGKTPVCQDVANFKTATSPVVSVIDTKTGREVAGAAANLNARFDAFFREKKIDAAGRRFPLVSNDLAFVPGTNVGYVTANGIDAVFRVVYDATGKITEVGSSTSPVINLNPAGIEARLAGKGPIGIAIGAANKKFALVANDITRNVTTVDFNTQAIAGGVASPSVTATAALPPKGSDAEHVLIGKDLFNTGRARWSLNGEGWGACQSCHTDGLSDNVTWFFGRGPRQSTSLDGSFASKNPNDQRILNHTSNRDEFADFELNTRNTSGGVGAIVLAKSTPPVNLDRLDTPALKLAELDGSSLLAADPTNPLKLGLNAAGQVVVGQLMIDPHAQAAGGLLDDWANITRYAQTIRSPRKPSNLDAAKVAAGAELFSKYGSCQGCHGGDKWTVSKRFYEPSVETMAALKTTNFVVPTGFPAALLPAEQAADQKLVINAGGESVQCVLRNVKTFGVVEDGLGVAELRGTNMKDVAQGNGNAVVPNADGDNNPANDPKANIGYNVPSLLGLSVAAPFFHHGGARTIEGVLSGTFATHARALAPNFLIENDAKRVATQVDQLTHYLLSIDEDTAPLTLPAPGPQGGALCPENVGGTPARY
ncbi:MAG: hypothetical protein ABW252_19985 [Polyangiales bacterium]